MPAPAPRPGFDLAQWPGYPRDHGRRPRRPESLKGGCVGPSSGAERPLPWLPDEQFELALDAQRGALAQPGDGGELLTLTTHRAIRLGRQAGKRTTAALLLDRLTAVEITDVGRSARRMAQGLLVLGASLVLGAVIWVVLDVFLFALLVAGVPGLIGIYILAGYAFPDDRGELALHAGAYALRLPLLSEAARRGSYLLAQRVFELMALASPRVERGGAPEPFEAGSDGSDVEAVAQANREPEAGQAAGPSTPPVPDGPTLPVPDEPTAVAETAEAPVRRRTVRKPAPSEMEAPAAVPEEPPPDAT